MPPSASGKGFDRWVSFNGDAYGFRWMYVVDAVGLFVVMIAINVARFGSSWPTYDVASYLFGFAVAMSVHLLTAYFGGLYDREHRLGNPSRLAKILRLTSIAVLIDAALSLGADKYVMPRLNLLVFALLASLVLAFNRWLAQVVRTARFGRPRVLLVGSPDDIELAEAHLKESDRDAQLVGRRSTVADLGAAVEATGASDVLLLSGSGLASIYPSPLEDLEKRKVGVYHRLSPADTLLGVSRSRQIAGMPFIALHSHALPQSKVHFKRSLDLIYVLVAAPIVVPLVGLLWLYGRIVSGRPVLYQQERIGLRGSPFVMYKLRTMYCGSEDESGPVLAERDDPRVIPAMAWLRAMRLDELMQLWNVVKGDMALVGPRPERPDLVSQFEELLPGYGRRHELRPGITGLAQVHGRYHTDAGYKLGHDLQYLVNWTPILDLQILFKTVAVVLGRRL